jgi:hypothetical protein
MHYLRSDGGLALTQRFVFAAARPVADRPLEVELWAVAQKRGRPRWAGRGAWRGAAVLL